MNEMDWLATRCFQEAIRHEFSWSFVFDGGTNVKAECLWRLLEDNRIRMTSRDDGHPFGLPAAMDAVLEINKSLAGATCKAVTLLAGTLDLEIRFDTGHCLQLIPDSSGYESWAASDPQRQFIAAGGGSLFQLPGVAGV